MVFRTETQMVPQKLRWDGDCDGAEEGDRDGLTDGDPTATRRYHRKEIPDETDGYFVMVPAGEGEIRRRLTVPRKATETANRRRS
jgi:hypothetical protein